MPDTDRSLRTKIDKAKDFVKEHRTATACVATAVVSTVVTRKIDTRIAQKFAYEMGVRAGVLELSLETVENFLEEKGLMEEFLNAVYAS